MKELREFIFQDGRWTSGEHDSEIVEWGSLTKQVTAFLVIDTILNKGLKLETECVTISENLNLSILNLLQHRSGLPRVPDDITKYSDYTNNDLLNYVKKIKLSDFNPSKYHYSNIGYAFLAKWLEEKNQKTFKSQVDTFLRDFLGLHSARMLDREEFLKLTRSNGNVYTKMFWFKDNYFQGAGGIVSTISDLKKFSNHFFSEKCMKFVRYHDIATRAKFKDGDISRSFSIAYESYRGLEIKSINGGTETIFLTLVKVDDERLILVLSGPNVSHTQAILNNLDEQLNT